MIKEVTIKAIECTCEALLKSGKPCGYRWISTAVNLPESCRNPECRSREWNGKKQRIRPTRIELPKPAKLKWAEEETDF